MTDIYIDPELSSNTNIGAYSIANRDNSGSDGTGYKTTIDAFSSTNIDANGGAGTNIFFRGGTHIIAATDNIFRKVQIYAVDGEIAEVVGTMDGTSMLSLTKDGIIINGKVGTGRLRFSNPTQTSAIRFLIQFAKLDIIVNDVEFYNHAGVAIEVVVGGSGAVLNRPIIRGGAKALRIATATPTVTINSPFLEDVGFIGIDVSANITINNPTIIPKVQAVASAANAPTIILNNPLILGANVASGTVDTFNAGAGTITVNRGVVNHSIQAPHDNQKDANTTFNSVTENALIKLKNDGANECIVSVGVVGGELPLLSTAVTGGYLGADYAHQAAEYQAVCNDVGVNMAWFPDDMQHYGDTSGIWFDAIPGAKAWIAAGNEVGCHAHAGDSPAQDTPIWVIYSGLNANPRVVVSNSGQQWALVTDSGTDATFDTSRGGLYFHLGASPSLFTGINAETGWAAQPFDGGAGYDDSFSDTIEDGTYLCNLEAGTDTAKLSYNDERFIAMEITDATSIFEAATGAVITSYMYLTPGKFNTWNAGETTLRDKWEAEVARLFDVAISQLSSATVTTEKFTQTITGISFLDVKRAIATTVPEILFMGTGNSPGSDAGNAARIREAVRSLMSYGRYYGLWIVIVLPDGGSGYWEGPELFALMDELNNSARVLTPSQAKTWIDSNTVTVTSGRDFSQTDDSAGIGGGRTGWVGEPSPTGQSGEPHSDVNTSAGCVQDTLSPFHPVNL